MPSIVRNAVVRLAAIAIALVCATQFARSADLAPLFAELTALDTPHYTGGLPSRNRALAARIRAAMLPQFPEISCSPPDEGVLVIDADDGTQEASLKGLDPNLIRLLTALDDEHQEVRDTAAYTIGLLGPSAKGAVPFLRKLFAGSYVASFDHPPKRKGNWSNDAYGKLVCENIVAADFSEVIPEDLLPPREPFAEFLRKSAVLLPTLYLDADVEYPPDMMARAFGNYAIIDYAEDAAPLLAKILSDDTLSRQKRLEVAEILMRVPRKIAEPSIAGLLRLTGTNDPQLRYFVGEALFQLRHPAAIPLLVERIGTSRNWYWDKLCEYGVAARGAAEAPLLAVLAQAKRWPTDMRAAIEVLGCIRSRKAVPVILPMLAFPDWVTQRKIAMALGEIGDRSLVVENALLGLTKHWSKRVRMAAQNALSKLSGAPTDLVDPVPETRVVVVGGTVPTNHGLPWCDVTGKYSIDGKTWFNVSWTTSAPPLPADFPVGVAGDGSAWTLRVDDGWIYGADIGEFGGGLWHISDTKVVTELELRRHTNIYGIVKNASGIFAFAYQVAINGHSGVLLKVARGPDGRWQSTRVAVLPGAPSMFAAGPNGEILLSDEANTFAVIDNEIVPLQCDKVHPGSYFTDHPGDYDQD